MEARGGSQPARAAGNAREGRTWDLRHPSPALGLGFTLFGLLQK